MRFDHTSPFDRFSPEEPEEEYSLEDILFEVGESSFHEDDPLLTGSDVADPLTYAALWGEEAEEADSAFPEGEGGEVPAAKGSVRPTETDVSRKTGGDEPVRPTETGTGRKIGKTEEVTVSGGESPKKAYAGTKAPEKPRVEDVVQALREYCAYDGGEVSGEHDTAGEVGERRASDTPEMYYAADAAEEPGNVCSEREARGERDIYNGVTPDEYGAHPDEYDAYDGETPGVCDAYDGGAPDDDDDAGEEDAVPAPASPDSARRRRMSLRRTAPFFAALLALTLLSWTLPLRPTYSALEMRDLEKFPDFSLSALFSGDWFEGISLWFSDTFPLRERWVSAQSRFSQLYGDQSIIFSGSLSGVLPTEMEPEPTLAPEPTPEPTPVAELPATEPEDLPEVTPEPTPEPTPDPAAGVLFDANEARRIGATIIFGDSAYEAYNLGPAAAEAYSWALSRGADRYVDQCRVFSIICPNSGGIVLSYDIYDQLYLIRQGDAIEHFYTNKSDNLIPVYIYDTLRAHNTEYLYFRTDHHWTALAAWYAYEQFCEAAGFTPVPLSEYTEYVYPGFLGSFYRNTMTKAMEENPDTVYAYDPPGNITAVYSPGPDSYQWIEVPCVVDKSNTGSETKYLAFLNGDHYETVITNHDIEDDSACLVIKDSYANPFVLYLTQHYHTVVVRDWHYYNALGPLVQKYGIDDVIVLTEVVQAQGNDMLESLRNTFFN